ncbi:Inward rectifier potassium channel irk-1 [Orchesella cincta]|uniref:Inward rectifier potassium channel irk-1 n=1 Tax=Orchesella cincta TaxID=48709 RepID=A0A1D2MUY8_ORCCI|nr:Inward rectifier potassium channel irk-1 [Orchesella cincta]
MSVTVDFSSMDRAVSKNGKFNIVPTNVGKKFMVDLFTTLLEVRWRWMLFLLIFINFAVWFVFAIIWFAILHFHGDIENYGNENWEPCITGIQNFTSAFLFSIETQTTTGFGHYHLTERCIVANIVFGIQSIVGFFLVGLLVGLVITKVLRPKKRSETIRFSKNAVISRKDGILCFMCRVADMRKSSILEAHVRVILLKKQKTSDGQVVCHQEELEVGGEGERNDKVLLFWPTIVMHKITDSSPLRNITAADLNSSNIVFEIIVVLEGIVDSTGLTLQARSSYISSEVNTLYPIRSLL